MPTSGTSKDIANDLLSFVEGKIIILENMKTMCAIIEQLLTLPGNLTL